VSPVAPIDWALAYAAHGLAVFPMRADRTPITEHGYQDASTEAEVIKAWWRRYPFSDPAWAAPEGVVAVDLDPKSGGDGVRDFARLDGHDPHDIETPSASTPSGGMHLFYAVARRYQNSVKLHGCAIDIRSRGGCVILPAQGNGRRWLRRLSKTPMAEAPAWLDCALRKVSVPRLFRTATPSWLRPLERKQALAELERACAKMIAAPNGAQDDTRHRQCFLIGALIARGDLDSATGFAALAAAARAMPTYGKPWRDLDKRVERSLKAGIDRPSVL
jgi:hypothetical protein